MNLTGRSININSILENIMSSVYMELRRRIMKIQMTWMYTRQKQEMNISIGVGEIGRVHRAGRGKRQ